MGLCRVLRRSCQIALVIAVTAAMEPHRAIADSPHSKGISLRTADRVQTSGWWPSKGEANRDDYVGSAICGTCHAEKARTWQTTAMAHAGDRVTRSDILRQHDRLSSQIGSYRYEIASDSDKTIQEVSSPNSRSSESLLWAFGVGRMGQTYIYEKSGVFYEAHLSFYSNLQGLDVTPGQSLSLPASPEEAAGRAMPAAETRSCFGCHTTASTTKGRFDTDRLFAGVTCEACHGPGAKHISAVKAGDAAGIENSVLNPDRMGPEDAVDFCGACHRSWEDVVSNGGVGLGMLNVRFAPYRLENSRCWKQGDKRLTCTSCHDPHKPLVQNVQAYDLACLQCHATTRGSKRKDHHPGAACPVATRECVTCHMPKYEPANLHSQFTDHWIRVVKAGKIYPE